MVMRGTPRCVLRPGRRAANWRANCLDSRMLGSRASGRPQGALEVEEGHDFIANHFCAPDPNSQRKLRTCAWVEVGHNLRWAFGNIRGPMKPGPDTYWGESEKPVSVTEV